MKLPVEVSLKRPVVVGDTTIEKLFIDELSLGDQIDFEDMTDTFEDPPTDAQNRRSTIFMLSRMAGVSEQVARSIKGSDTAEVLAAMDQVMGPPDTGDAGGNGQLARTQKS